jgi:hypothetical protein
MAANRSMRRQKARLPEMAMRSRPGKRLTPEEFADELFKFATSWLKWKPKVALNTPISQIELAHEGWIDCLKATDPHFRPSDDAAPPRNKEEEGSRMI